MTIEQYLRLELTNKWVSLVKQNECEICGSKENLEVHHIKQFIILLDETLKLLNLDNKDNIENYLDEELEKIKLIMLGKHLEVESLTLCTKCHDELHKLNGVIKLYDKKSVREKISKELDKEKAIKHLEKMESIRLFKEAQNNLKDFFTNKLMIPLKLNHGIIGFNLINEYLKENKIPFIIRSMCSSKRIDGEVKSYRYWIVEKEISHEQE